MKINIEIDEKTLKSLVYDYIQGQLGGVSVDFDKIKIEVKSKQNYRSEWEVANFRAVYNKET